MNDISISSTATFPRRTQRYNSAMEHENRDLRGVVAALRQRIGQEEQAARERAGQMLVLRQANQHLVLAAFTAEDLHAAAELTNERQTVFLSMLAHELRNPIAAISFANTVMRGLEIDNAKLDKLLDIVARQSNHLVRLVDDLLDVSRLRTGKLTLQFHDGTLAEILEGAIMTAQPVINQREQAVRMELPAADVKLHADHVRLAQLFSNLLVNASKFSPPHSTLYIGAAVQGPFVAVTVRDEGKGIAIEDMDRMFELFEQGPDESGHTLSGGLGIGLSLVRSIAVMHGGSVSVTSAGAGQGSEFTVLLPLPATDADPRSMSLPDAGVDLDVLMKG